MSNPADDTIFESFDPKKLYPTYERLLEYPKVSDKEVTYLATQVPSVEWSTLKLGKWFVAFLKKDGLNTKLNGKDVFDKANSPVYRLKKDAFEREVYIRLHHILSLDIDNYYRSHYFLIEPEKWNIKYITFSSSEMTGPVLDKICMMARAKNSKRQFKDNLGFDIPYFVEILIKWGFTDEMNLQDLEKIFEKSINYKSETLELNRFIVMNKINSNKNSKLPMFSHAPVSTYLVKHLLKLLLSEDQSFLYLNKTSKSRYQVYYHSVAVINKLPLKHCYNALRLYFGLEEFDLDNKNLFMAYEAKNIETSTFIKKEEMIPRLLMSYHINKFIGKEWISILTSKQFYVATLNCVTYSDNTLKKQQLCKLIPILSSTLIRNNYITFFLIQQMYGIANINYPFDYFYKEASKPYLIDPIFQQKKLQYTDLPMLENKLKYFKNQIYFIDPDLQLPFDIETIPDAERGKHLIDMEKKYIPTFFYQVWKKGLQKYYFLNQKEEEIKDNEIPNSCVLKYTLFENQKKASEIEEYLADLFNLKDVYLSTDKEDWCYYKEDETIEHITYLQHKISNSYIFDLYLRKNKDKITPDQVNKMVESNMQALTDPFSDLENLRVLKTHFDFEIRNDVSISSFLACVCLERNLGPNYKSFLSVLYKKWIQNPLIRKIVESIVMKRKEKFKLRPLAFTVSKTNLSIYGGTLSINWLNSIRIHQTMLIIHGNNEFDSIENVDDKAFLMSEETLTRRRVCYELYQYLFASVKNEYLDEDKIDDLYYYFIPITLPQLQTEMFEFKHYSDNTLRDVIESIYDYSNSYSFSSTSSPSTDVLLKAFQKDDKESIIQESMKSFNTNPFLTDPRLVSKRQTLKGWSTKKETKMDIDYDEFDNLTIKLDNISFNSMYQIRPITKQEETCSLEKEEEIELKEDGKIHTKGRRLVKTIQGSDNIKPKKVCVQLKK